MIEATTITTSDGGRTLICLQLVAGRYVRSKRHSCLMPASGKRAQFIPRGMASRVGGSFFIAQNNTSCQAGQVGRLAARRQARHRWPRRPAPMSEFTDTPKPVRFK